MIAHAARTRIVRFHATPMLDFRRFEARPCRLPDPGALLRFRSGYRLDRQAQGGNQRRFSYFRPLGSGVDHQPGVHRREPGRAGSDRHVRFGREVRDHDRALLLDRRGAGDAVRRRLHDAVLLRQPRAQRAGISEAALRREDSRAERRHLRRDDGVFVRHFDVRARACCFNWCCGWSFTASVLLSAAIVLVYTFLGRTYQRDLQRSAAIFPDRAGIRAAVDFRRS